MVRVHGFEGRKARQLTFWANEDKQPHYGEHADPLVLGLAGGILSGGGARVSRHCRAP
jgi:hypothetical protein